MTQNIAIGGGEVPTITYFRNSLRVHFRSVTPRNYCDDSMSVHISHLILTASDLI